MLVEGSKEAVNFMTSVFETDWATATSYTVNQTYPTSDMDIITSTHKRSYSPPDIAPGMAPTPTPEAASDVSALKVYTSPDSAHASLFEQLQNATKSVEIEIYQVTDDSLCSFLEQVGTAKNGPTLKLLVSKYIFGPTDHSLAMSCYTKLHAAGLTVRMTQDVSFYQYCHQKFWIVDGKTVGMSTGNWSPSDYPQNYRGVPHGEAGWEVSNRDYTMEVTSPSVVKSFQSVLDGDYEAGEDFSKRNGPIMR